MTDSWISLQLQSYYHLDTLSQAANSMGAANQYGPANTNALAHALSIAAIAYDHNSFEASLLGDLRESNTTYDYYKKLELGQQPADSRWDTTRICGIIR